MYKYIILVVVRYVGFVINYICFGKVRVATLLSNFVLYDCSASTGWLLLLYVAITCKDFYLRTVHCYIVMWGTTARNGEHPVA